MHLTGPLGTKYGVGLERFIFFPRRSSPDVLGSECFVSSDIDTDWNVSLEAMVAIYSVCARHGLGGFFLGLGT